MWRGVQERIEVNRSLDPVVGRDCDGDFEGMVNGPKKVGFSTSHAFPPPRFWIDGHDETRSTCTCDSE